MSEYQYYEFQAVDRPLSSARMEELRRYSSRAQITPSSFINVYHYGDFRGDPDKLVGKYFDAFLYLANWGTRWFMLRVPKRLLDPTVATSYSAGDCLSSRQQGDHLVLSFRSEEEGDYEWAEGEGWLASLLPIRAALMRGDHRVLYLGWLLGAQDQEVGDDAVEPAVPPGLAELDAPLTQLAAFLRIDTEAAERARQRAKREREAAKQRKEHLESLPGKETSLWSKVHQLIDTRQAKGYDEAVSLLCDLRDLAKMQQDAEAFRVRMTALHEENTRRTALVKRFRKARLLD